MPSTLGIPICIAVLALIGCAGRAPHLAESTTAADSRRQIDTCPSLTDSISAALPSDSTGSIRIGEDALHGIRFVSILIDGQRAAWNEPKNNPGPEYGPDLDPNDIETVEVLKPAVARSRYGTCPGVVITTKSKRWHPSSGPDR